MLDLLQGTLCLQVQQSQLPRGPQIELLYDVQQHTEEWVAYCEEPRGGEHDCCLSDGLEDLWVFCQIMDSSLRVWTSAGSIPRYNKREDHWGKRRAAAISGFRNSTYTEQCIEQGVWQLGIYQIKVLGKEIRHHSGVCLGEETQGRLYERSQGISVNIGARPLYCDDEERDSEQQQRHHSTNLKQAVYTSVVSVRVRRMVRGHIIRPIFEPCTTDISR